MALLLLSCGRYPDIQESAENRHRCWPQGRCTRVAGLTGPAANSFAFLTTSLDQRASSVITGFRERATSQLNQGKSMPAAPETIYALQALRLAAEVQQMVALQSALGSQGSARLERFLGNEFTRGGES